MNKTNLARILLCVFIFGALIAFAFVDTTQTATGNAVEITGYASVIPEETASDAEALPETEAAAAAEETVTTAEPQSGFLDKVEEINGFLNSNIAWGLFMCFLLVGTGIYLSLRTGFLQFSHFGLVMKQTIGKLFSKGKNTAEEGALTPFQAFCTALAATVGTGNIAGVTGAIVLGGPGAVMWMWIAALFGMVTKYAEIVLAIKYREKNKAGEWVGGPMYYIKNGLGKGWGWLAVLFSIFGCLAAFGTGSMTQFNTIAGTIVTAVDSVTGTVITGTGTEATIRLIIGIAMGLLGCLIILGGLKRIGSVAEKIVPFMSLLYIIGSLVVIGFNFDRVGIVFASIFRSAFTKEAIVGGVGGYVFMNTIKRGVARGVFSNEAGLGSAPIAHATSSEKDPVKQGLYGVFEVFTDTIIICTMTALVVLTSNIVPWGDASMAGADTTILAFGTVFGQKFSSIFIAVSILFFAYTTFLSWSLYGSRCLAYLTHDKGVKVYQFIYIIVAVLGATMNLSLVWDIADTLNGFMAIPNLIALLALSGVVIKLTKEYFSNKT